MKELTQQQVFNECRELLKNATSLVDLQRNAKRVDQLIKEHGLDYYQEQKLEDLGFRLADRLDRDESYLLKNSKIIFKD